MLCECPDWNVIFGYHRRFLFVVCSGGSVHTHILTHILKVLLYSLSPVCHSSSSEQRASWLPGSDNPSVYSHATFWKVQESAPPNAAQTQASKSVRPAGVRHMPAQAWPLRLPYAPLGFSQTIPDPFLYFSCPPLTLSVFSCLSLTLFSRFIPSGVSILTLQSSFPWLFGMLQCLAICNSKNFYIACSREGLDVCKSVCERQTLNLLPALSLILQKKSWTITFGHAPLSTAWPVQLGWIWCFNTLILANSIK